MPTIQAQGSYGTLTIHHPSGAILSGTGDMGQEGVSPEYADIVWVDPARIPQEAIASGHCDILALAFVTQEGSYVRETPFVPFPMDDWPDYHEWREPAGLLCDYSAQEEA